ncbi:sulfite exporter TauE/SafE family protein [Cyanobium sp. T1G-Tous]|nr:sulfite exporter TauE/SafE family protein [Cyanobium sp. T1G-Tous]
MDADNLLGLAAAGVAAGLINAVAGGGSLISFPALIATGIPIIMANITSSLALLPGYLAATYAQRKEIASLGPRVLWLLPAAAAGGLIGAFLLTNSSEEVFAGLVPWLILLGSLLLAIQDQLRQRLLSSAAAQPMASVNLLAVAAVLIATVYGGYFGAGLGVILLAVLGVTLHGTLTQLNGLKQAIAFVAKSAAALVFLWSGEVDWGAAVLMAFGSLVGGFLGGKLVGKVNPRILRTVVILSGIALGLYYLFS